MHERAPTPPELVDAGRVAAARVVDALAALPAADLAAPSRLPGWSRLTVACHLRYGGRASRRMTDDALAGRVTEFYPGGRDHLRPATLRPEPGESPADVVRSLALECDRSIESWGRVPTAAWRTVVREPTDRPDLGPIDLATLALLRLTELEVHGRDLDIGTDGWSTTFVSAALPLRLAGLHRQRRVGADHPLVGRSWALRPDGAEARLVTLRARDVVVAPLDPAGGPPRPEATIAGAPADLLALLLGRPGRAPLRTQGDPAVAAAFTEAFGGP